MLVLTRVAIVSAIVAATTAPRAHAQTTGEAPAPDSLARFAGSVRVQALALATRVDPALGGRAYSEGYLSQPVILARGSALRGHVEGIITLDFEGLTLDRGQLTPGAYGEGYVDRRHPHTYLHEAIAVVRGAFGGTGVSLAGGKGFVPFGTDDPMMRPFAAYPVNHHLAQILERYVITAAVRRGPVEIEGSVFNGDEPASPGAPPDAGRFGDSWSARGTISWRRGLEAQGSVAVVTSPEIAEGGGLDHRMWSTALRYVRPTGLVRYAMMEWAVTDAVLGNLRTNRFTSFLGEASAQASVATISLRYENTTRPEELRLQDPFRTSRSPTDLTIIGITRWQTVTTSVSVARTFGALGVAPFAEVGYARPTQALTPSAFEPRGFYGARSIWMVSGGVRIGVGPTHRRMGRYGVGLPNEAPVPTHVGH